MYSSYCIIIYTIAWFATRNSQCSITIYLLQSTGNWFIYTIYVQECLMYVIASYNTYGHWTSHVRFTIASPTRGQTGSQHVHCIEQVVAVAYVYVLFSALTQKCASSFTHVHLLPLLAYLFTYPHFVFMFCSCFQLLLFSRLCNSFNISVAALIIATM